MKHFLLYILCTVACIGLFTSCGDNATNNSSTQSNGTGEIYGYVQLYDCYGNKETNQSGVTAQLLVENNIQQTVATDATGLFTFKNVGAGVYGIRFFKKECVWQNTKDDTLTADNIQFIGTGRFRIDEYKAQNNSRDNKIAFSSTNAPDSTYWLLNPNVAYEIVKTIDTVSVWIKDTTWNDTSGYTRRRSIYGKGTREFSIIKYIVEYQTNLQNENLERRLKFHYIFDDGTDIVKLEDLSLTQKQYAKQIETENMIIRDSLGQVMTKQNNKYTYSDIYHKKIKVWAESEIPNGAKDIKKPRRIVSTNVLSIDIDK